MDQNRIFKIYLIILANCLTSLAFFLTIPLIGLYAIDHFQVSASEAGLLSAIWPATVFVCSFFVGRLADQRGCLSTMKWGNAICIGVFFAMAAPLTLSLFIATLFLFGLGKSLSEISVRTSIATMSTPEELPRLMRLRYVGINIVGVGGPLLGYLSYKTFSGHAFMISGLLYGIALLILTSMLSKDDLNSPLAQKKDADVLSNIEPKGRFTVFQDPNLQRFLVSGTLIMAAYGCFETVMPIFAEASHGLRPNFGFIAGTNAITVVFSQLGILRWASKVSNRVSVLSGFALMVLGFLMYSIEGHAFVMTLIATVVFSLGESILFPAIELVLNEIAVTKHRAAYFAAAETRQIGFFIGPALGGFVYDRCGSTVFFVFVALLLAFAMWNCSKLLKRTSKSQAVACELEATVAS